MSAYIVEDKTINNIIAYLEQNNEMKWYLNGMSLDTDEQREHLGKKLFQMNVDAVNERYGDGEASKFRPLGYQYHYELSKPSIKTYKSLQCFLYQCSEGKVVESDLYKKMRTILHGIGEQIICKLPGYDEAEWG